MHTAIVQLLCDGKKRVLMLNVWKPPFLKSSHNYGDKSKMLDCACGEFLCCLYYVVSIELFKLI